jgi:hypothetical protein
VVRKIILMMKEAAMLRLRGAQDRFDGQLLSDGRLRPFERPALRSSSPASCRDTPGADLMLGGAELMLIDLAVATTSLGQSAGVVTAASAEPLFRLAATRQRSGRLLLSNLLSQPLLLRYEGARAT